MGERIRVDFSSVREPLERYPWEIMLKQGYHWMDKYGDAHWIGDMETSYLENALKFARMACRNEANRWWSFAMMLNGEMAVEMAMNTAERYEEGTQPLVCGLENELARRRGEEPPYHDWQLVSDSITNWLEDAGREHMGVLNIMHARGMYPTTEPGIYKLGEPWNPETDG